MECQHCGKTVNSDMLFCPFCGQPIDKDKSAVHSEVNGREPQSSSDANEGSGDAFWEDLWSKAEAEAKKAEGMDTTVAFVESSNEKATGTKFVKKKPVSQKRPIMVAAIIAVVLVAVGSAVGISTHNSHVKADTYETALSYQKRSRYEEAIELYQSLGDYEDAAQQSNYCEALVLCNSGEYESAYNLLISMEDYREFDDAVLLLKQIYYETRLFEAINDLKAYMKNPSSLQILSVSFHYNSDEESDSYTLAKPSCIIKESGQNGYGGYSISYILCREDDESGSYECYYSCDDLDASSYDLTDDDEFYDWLSCVAINLALDSPEIADTIDLDRVNNIMAQNQYSRISRISDLEYEDFGDIEADGVISSSEEDSNDA